MYLPSVITHFHFKVFIVNVCVLEYIVCMANINNLLFSISQYKSSQKVFHRFLYTSKFYPSRRSSKMIAAMKTNKTKT